VRVVGGFTERQFAERRLPTLAEINSAGPDTPVFILHVYDRALFADDLRTYAIPQCGHLPPEEQPDIVNTLLLEFLSGWSG
jgi:pimeloyl-ACP methyl ester carboxylesterase